MKTLAKFIGSLIASQWKYLRFGFIFGILFAIASLFFPDYYKSVVTVLPNTDSKGVGSILSGAKSALAATGMGLGVDLGGGDDQSMSYEDIIRSRQVVLPILNKTYSYNKKWWHYGKYSTKTETILSYLDEVNNDKGQKAFLDLIDIKKDLKTGVFKIEVETISPQLSQMLATDLYTSLDRVLILNSQKQAKSKAEFLSRQIDIAQKAASEKEARLVAWRNKNLNYQTTNDPEVKIIEQNLATDLQSKRQFIDGLSMQKEQSLLDSENSAPVLTLLDPPNLPIEKSFPPRAILLLISTVFATLVYWSLLNHHWLRRNLVIQPHITSQD
jgi:hypothetical protein